jgi:hypothetical protein
MLIMADDFSLISPLKPVVWFIAATGFPLLAESGNRHIVNNLFESQRRTHCIPALNRKATIKFPLSADTVGLSLSVICSLKAGSFK